MQGNTARAYSWCLWNRERGAWNALCVLPTDTPLFYKQASVFTGEVRRRWSYVTSWNLSTLDDFSWSNGAWYFFTCKLWLTKPPSSLLEAESIPGPMSVLISHKRSGKVACGTANFFWPGWCLGAETLSGQKIWQQFWHAIMRWHQWHNSALEAEVKPHLSYYISLTNQDHHSKMPAAMTHRESSVSIGHLQTEFVPGLGTTPFSFSSLKSAQGDKFLYSQESVLTNRMRFLWVIMECCLPLGIVTACLTYHQETCKKVSPLSFCHG